MLSNAAILDGVCADVDPRASILGKKWDGKCSSTFANRLLQTVGICLKIFAL
jgi:hypothetical protein